MKHLTFSRCVIYATVGTLVDRDLSSEEENRLTSGLKWTDEEEATDGKLYTGRPPCRWGVHPDILLRTGLTGSPESRTAQELFLGLDVTQDGLCPEGFLRLILDDVTKTEFKNETQLLKQVLWPDGLGEKQEDYYPSPAKASLLARLFPSGVSTCTLRLELDSSDERPVSDVQLDNLLDCLDPRRRTAPTETLLKSRPPDLTKMLGGLLAALSTAASQVMNVNEPIDDGQRRRTLFTDRGALMRARVEWTPIGLPPWARPEVEQLPYCTLDLEMGESPFWENNQESTIFHRRLFHLMAGTYLGLDSKTLRIPTRLRSPYHDERLDSLSWSTDSFVFGTARGSVILFRSQNGEWLEKPGVVNAYRQSSIDAIEAMIGAWNALGLLNVSVDQCIQELTLEPQKNVEPLKHLATVRRIFARLLSEPMFYQAEGSTVRSISKRVRGQLGVLELRESLLQKLSEVRDLHDLLLHLAALKQIQSERGE